MNAIMHYPTCGVILIPNIIYYLSFNIPVYATQFMEWFAQLRQSRKSSLLEAKLINGGSIELTFATTRRDNRRHENAFVRVFHSGASLVSHPFSTFSRDAFANNTELDDNNNSTTLSILLRSKGPFAEGLRNSLFPNNESATSSSGSNVEDVQRLVPSSWVSPSSAHQKILFDSYYAGSYNWVDNAITSHDKILIVAGGVGIVPFLTFLPSLNRRIQASQVVTSEDQVANPIGLKHIHLHWYCREIGLASHVWHNYLHTHIHKDWESNNDSVGIGSDNR